MAQAEILDGYRLEAPIGEGGFGVVYRGLDPAGKPVAIKRLRESGADPEDLADEFRLLRRLRHEHVVPLLDFGFSGGAPYLVTEWIEGTDLKTYGTGRPLLELAPTLAGVLRALEHLHARGVLHRDLKPRNVLVDRAGKAKLIDFGLAGVAEQTGSRSGTPAYAPPERLLGRPEDGRSDLYSFGVILHELLTGALPAPGALRPSGSPAADALLARLLAPHPAGRPATANEVIAALGAAAGLDLAEERGTPEGPAGPVPGLVGRERELERFRRLLGAPRHRALLVSGEAGIGKSHLLRAFAAEACAGRARVLEGRSLADLEAAAARTGPSGRGGLDLADRLLAIAAARRTVVLIDDLHLLAPAELEDIVALATRLDTRPHPAPGCGLLLVLAHRPADGADQEFAGRLERLAALGRTRRLAVGPLPRPAVAAFVVEFLGRTEIPEDVLDALHERGGGRPAEMAELVRALRRSGAIVWERGAFRRSGGPLVWPPSATDALRAEIASLEPAAREALRWLAAAGPLRPSELRRLSGGAVDRETLDSLAAGRGLLTRLRTAQEGFAYAFAGDRVAAALGPDPDSARRHDALARERRHDPERALAHAARGSDRLAALEALDAASARIERDPVAARSLLSALAAGPALAGAERARAAIALASAELRLDLREAARARLDALGAVPAELEAAHLAARARALGRGDPRLEEVLGRVEAALAGPDAAGGAEAALAAAAALEAAGPEVRSRLRGLCERVEAAAIEGRDEGLRGRALLAIGALLAIEGEAAAARERLEEARRLALPPRGEGGLEFEAALKLASHLARAGDDAAAAVAAAGEALSLAERLGGRHDLGRALAVRAAALVRADDLRAAAAVARRAPRHLAGRGPVADFVRVLMSSAYIALKLGRAREAERHARRAIRLAVSEAHAPSRLGALTNLTFALVRQGRAAAATGRAALEEGKRRGLADIVAVSRYLLGLDAVERGLAAEAREALADPIPEGSFHLDCLGVDLELLLGRPAVARAFVELLKPAGAFTEAKALVRRAMAEIGLGNAPAAIEALSRARASGGHREDHFLAIELHLCEAEAYLAAGRRAEAEGALAEARRLIVPREMPALDARALLLGERIGGAGASTLGRRLGELRAALERLEGLGLHRDAHLVAGILAARTAQRAEAEQLAARTADAAEAARLRARAEAARRAMSAGLPEPDGAAFRDALERGLAAIVAALPEERPLEVPPAAAARLLSVYRALATEQDPDLLLPRVLDAAADLAGASRAFLLLREGKRLRVALGRGQGLAVDARRGGPSRTIAEAALTAGRPVRVAGAASDARFAAQHSVASIGLGGVLAVPLARGTGGGGPGGGAEGVIYVDDGGAGRAFGPEDEAVLVAFADQAALAIATAGALREERRRRERAERRMDEIRREFDRTTADLTSLRSALGEELDRLEARFEGMIGRSPAMRKVFGLVERSAPRDVPVLLTGETGTGKELTARAIHARSGRRERPFLAVNCGAIAPSLLESELFGHEAGAFTGATGRKAGIFEQAEGGTVFLDEIGEMPLPMQAALLRVIEAREVRRVGGRETVPVNVRVIAATNRDLKAMVAAGAFREDLFFRVRVFPIDLPPLRERLEDLPLLAEAIVAELAEAAGAPAPALAPLARRKLLSHPWPGNVRELRNVLARAVILSSGVGSIGEDAIDLDASPRAPGEAAAAPAAPPAAIEVIDFQVAKDRFIKSFLETALRRTGGNITHAAALTGMKRQAFGRLLANHGIDAKAFRC